MATSGVDVKVGKGKTEMISMTVDGNIFSKFNGTKVGAKAIEVTPSPPPYPSPTSVYKGRL